MIDSQALSLRVFNFFDVIFGAEKTDFGFNADPTLAFRETEQNNEIRNNDQTILYYRVEGNANRGNSIKSDMVIYNRVTKKEEIYPVRKVTVVMNVVSKKKGQANDVMQAFLRYIQSSRKNVACYGLPFILALVKSDEDINLTALEEGAWAERREKKLYFTYCDKIEIGDVQFTQEPATVEDVKDIIQYELITK
jgi:hypothetical protein